MTLEEFKSLCSKASKSGPIASWVITDVEKRDLLRHYIAVQCADQTDEWQVYSYDARNGVEDLGKFQGRTPMEVYKIVPRKALA